MLMVWERRARVRVPVCVCKVFSRLVIAFLFTRKIRRSGHLEQLAGCVSLQFAHMGGISRFLMHVIVSCRFDADCFLSAVHESVSVSLVTEILGLQDSYISQ